MTKVKLRSDGCLLDQINGQTVAQGERLRVTWPDGTSEVVVAVVQADTYEAFYLETGRPYDAKRSRAFAKVSYHGIDVLIRLLELEAERVS